MPDFIEFARKLFELTDWPEGGELDISDFQDAAEACGLLTPETRFKPCEENCTCEEFHGDMSEGVICYRKCEELMTKPCDSAVIVASEQMNTTDPAPQTQPPTK